MIELTRSEVLVGPGPAAIGADVRAAVVRLDDPVRVVGSDPEIVTVAVGGRDAAERLASVGGSADADIQDPDGVGILGVGDDMGVVPSALAPLAATVREDPRCSGVVAAEDAAIEGFDDRIQSLRICRRDGEPDLADDALRQACISREVGPGLTAVRGFVKAAAGAAGVERVRRSPGFP